MSMATKFEHLTMYLYTCGLNLTWMRHELQYVQEVVTHLYSKLAIKKMGHYFLDTQYYMAFTV